MDIIYRASSTSLDGPEAPRDADQSGALESYGTSEILSNKSFPAVKGRAMRIYYMRIQFMTCLAVLM